MRIADNKYKSQFCARNGASVKKEATIHGVDRGPGWLVWRSGYYSTVATCVISKSATLTKLADPYADNAIRNR